MNCGHPHDPNSNNKTAPVDLFIIGGGVNGCGIARDAAGRGLSVVLAEKGDLAHATSSASSKMFHGGLRYLEYFEFGLVRKALKEREILLQAMPHISWPMRFVLPIYKSTRPAWLVRIGLFMYDHIGGRKILPATSTLDLRKDEAGKPLHPHFTKAFEYSDCWVQDARLVVLNARDAQDRGAEIRTRTKVIEAKREGENWLVTLENGDIVYARALVNAAGPWVGEVIEDTVQIPSDEGVRLVRGSHIITKKLFDHDRGYFFQGQDGRIVFVFPFEDEYTLIGTTDQDHKGSIDNPVCSKEEADYLRAFVADYLKTPIKAKDIVWSYSGIRPLYDDGASSATDATRDYVLSLKSDGAPLLNVFGGKVTTYRKLAESALAKLAQFFPDAGKDWTAGVPLPGGDFPVDGVATLIAKNLSRYPFLDAKWARRMVRCYGTEVSDIFGEARNANDLGHDFGNTLYEAELRWLMEKEFAKDADDVLWRRTKLGLRFSKKQLDDLQEWMQARR